MFLQGIYDAQLAQAALRLAKEYDSKSTFGPPTDKMGKPLDATEVAEIFLALPRQSSMKKVMPFLESQYHNISVDMVAKWCLIRQQIELERAEAEKENAPLLPVTSDDVSPQLPASSSKYSSSSRQAVPLAATVSASVSTPASPVHDPTPKAPPQTLHTVLPSSLEEPPISESPLPFLLLAGGPEDPLNPPLDKPLANLNATSDATRPVHSAATVIRDQDGEEDSHFAAVDAVVQNDALSSTQVCDADTIQSAAGTPSSPAHVHDSSVPVPLPLNSFEHQRPSSVPPPRTRIRSGLANEVSQDAEADSDTLFFSSDNLSVSSAGGVIGFHRVPPPDRYSVAHFDFGGTKSPTPASGAGSRGRMRRGRNEEGAVANGTARCENQDISGDGAAASSSKGPKRPREEERGEEEREEEEREEQEVNRPPRQRRRLDNFVSRLVDRFIPQYMQYMW
ncbi:hypothetical protein CPB85DRAFT_1326933 [Mucidula mucida]|nr:hypothetical protein CPB85DRAFT_1326933 [Mucidula mucida]